MMTTPNRTIEEQQKILCQIRDELATMRTDIHTRCVRFVDYALTDEVHFLQDYPAGRTLTVKNRLLSGPIVVVLKAAQVHLLSPILIMRGYVAPEQLDGFYRALQIEVAGDDMEAMQATRTQFMGMTPPEMVEALQVAMATNILGKPDIAMSKAIGHALHPLTIPAHIILARAFDDRAFVAELERKLEEFRDKAVGR